MTELLRPTEIDQTIASEWLSYSLGQGFVISGAVLRAMQNRAGSAYALLPDGVDRGRLADPRAGGVLRGASFQAALGELVDALAERGGRCVVVEDEVRRSWDPDPSLGGLLATGVIGERVLHWADVVDSSDGGVQVLNRGSHGYPRNAFVTSVSGRELGLIDGENVDQDIGNAVAKSLCAVIVGIYDDETVLVWEPA